MWERNSKSSREQPFRGGSSTVTSGVIFLFASFSAFSIMFSVSPASAQKKNAFSILFAVLIGVICSVLSVIFICILFGLGDVVARSLVSISVTTAIAIGITEQLGGVVALTVSSVIVTGILGASVSEFVCRKIGLTNPMARGLAIGNASHAAGTTAAMRMGAVEGGLSSLAIVLSGIFTAIVAPLAIWLFFFN
jgi:putative effector of murein hydrolase